MKFDRRGRLQWTRTPRSLRGPRMRSVTLAPNHDLLVTTSNGRNDRVLRISPRRR